MEGHVAFEYEIDTDDPLPGGRVPLLDRCAVAAGLGGARPCARVEPRGRVVCVGCGLDVGFEREREPRRALRRAVTPRAALRPSEFALPRAQSKLARCVF
jgi:hypothetical protein